MLYCANTLLFHIENTLEQTPHSKLIKVILQVRRWIFKTYSSFLQVNIRY